jgi:hypothetical protein
LTAAEEYFVSKTAATVLAFAGLLLFSVPMSAQFNGLLPNGNVYAGVSYAQLTDQVNQQSYKGWTGSFEALPFTRYPHIGFVLDGSGFYRKGVTQYNAVTGPRFSADFGKWRPFFQAMAGVRHLDSNDFVFNPIVIDIGGGVDYKLWFKNFSWRFQGDYMHTHYSSATQNDYRTTTGVVWRF